MLRRKRDFSKKNFRNPFFLKKQKGRRNFWAKFVIPAAVLILIIGLYYLNASDSLRIKNIEITGNEHISQAQIKSLILAQMAKSRFLVFSQNNILFFNKRQVKNELAKNYFFSELKIQKKYFQTLAVAVKEKTVRVIWSGSESKYYLDLTGQVLEKAEDYIVSQTEAGDTDLVRTQAVFSRYPLILDKSNAPISIGQKAVDEKLIDFVISLTEFLKKNGDFNISHYVLENPQSQDITLITDEGWEARFKIAEPVKTQGGMLLVVLVQKIKDRKTLQYIDLRFGEKVFYQ